MGSVFSPQKTVSLPLLSRPIIQAVYERISLILCLSHLSLHTQHSLEPFIILILAPGRLVRLFLDCSPFFLWLQPTVTLEVGAAFSFGCQETRIVLCIVTITH